MALQAWLKRVGNDIKANGILHAVWHRGSAAFQTLVARRINEVVISCDLTAITKPLKQTRMEQLEITDETIPLLRRFTFQYLNEANYRKLEAYRECGYHGDLALEDGEVIGYVWWVDQSTARRMHPAIARYGFDFGPVDAYSFDLYLAEPYRGGGRAREFYGSHLYLLRQRGFRRALGWVVAENTPARLLYRKLGYTELREQQSLQLCSTLLITGRRVYLRNGRRSAIPFDYVQIL